MYAVSAQARGYVRAAVNFQAARPVMRPGATTEVNLDLVRGEVLAGIVSLPLRSRDRLEGIKPGEETYVIRIDSASYSQNFETEPGGAFEAWAPRGVYSLVVLGTGEGARPVWKRWPAGRGSTRADRPADREGRAARAFDALWEDIARNYSYFELKKIDWTGLKTKYRARAIGTATLPEFVDGLGEMLGELDDGHVWFLDPRMPSSPTGRNRDKTATTSQRWKPR